MGRSTEMTRFGVRSLHWIGVKGRKGSKVASTYVLKPNTFISIELPISNMLNPCYRSIRFAGGDVRARF